MHSDAAACAEEVVNGERAEVGVVVVRGREEGRRSWGRQVGGRAVGDLVMVEEKRTVGVDAGRKAKSVVLLGRRVRSLAAISCGGWCWRRSWCRADAASLPVVCHALNDFFSMSAETSPKHDV